MAGLPLPKPDMNPPKILCMQDIEDAAAKKLPKSARGKFSFLGLMSVFDGNGKDMTLIRFWSRLL